MTAAVFILLSVVDRSCGMICEDGTRAALSNNDATSRKDLTSIVVKTFYNFDIQQVTPCTTIAITQQLHNYIIIMHNIGLAVR